MKRRFSSMQPWLVGYYGVWQLIHLGLNIWHFVGGVEQSPIRMLVGGKMTEFQISVFELSGYADTWVAIPLAFGFVAGYFRQKWWAVSIGLVSLTIAAYSAYVNVYLHILFGTFQFTWLSFVLGYLSFIPHLILLVGLVFRSREGRLQ